VGLIVAATTAILSCPLAVNASENINSLRELFSALQGCWRPPPIEHAFAGMTVVVKFSLKRDGELLGEPRIIVLTHRAPSETADAYRGAVNATLGHCLPLPLSPAFGGAVAGRPLIIRFVDNRQTMRQALKANHHGGPVHLVPPRREDAQT
jgi:hypothetical protein